MPTPAPTARLVFRTWNEDDLDLAMRLWGDPRVTALIDARGQLSRAEVGARLAAEIRCGAEHGIQYWPMALVSTGGFVGCAGLRPHEGAVLELGVHLCADQWGKGLATEAARAVIAHAFDVIGAEALFAGHNPGNHASRALLAKLGFRYTHDELYPATGAEHPSYLLQPQVVQI